VTQVNVVINGRQFRMACEDGEEEHLTRLAQELDNRIGGLRTRFGEIGDARLTVMAALMIADELSEATKRFRQLESELTSMQDARAAAARRDQATHAALIAAFNSAAGRIEDIARKLAPKPSTDENVAMG